MSPVESKTESIVSLFDNNNVIYGSVAKKDAGYTLFLFKDGMKTDIEHVALMAKDLEDAEQKIGVALSAKNVNIIDQSGRNLKHIANMSLQYMQIKKRSLVVGVN